MNRLYSSVNIYLKQLFPNNKSQIDYSCHAGHHCNSVLPQFTFFWQITEFPQLCELQSLQYCEMMSAFLGYLLQLFGV